MTLSRAYLDESRTDLCLAKANRTFSKTSPRFLGTAESCDTLTLILALGLENKEDSARRLGMRLKTLSRCPIVQRVDMCKVEPGLSCSRIADRQQDKLSDNGTLVYVAPKAKSGRPGLSLQFTLRVKMAATLDPASCGEILLSHVGDYRNPPKRCTETRGCLTESMLPSKTTANCFGLDDISR